MIDGGVGSHAPWLALLASRTKGSVVECGMGLFSTPLLHVLVSLQGRPLYSYETDPAWLEMFRELAGPLHPMTLLDNWRHDFEACDVAFVDCSPGRDERQDVSPRIDLIKSLKGKGRFIVAHDTEADIPPSGGAYGWAKLDSLFKYQTVLKQFRPWTTVYSDAEEFKP